MTNLDLGRVREAVAMVAAEHDVRLVLLFGSAARGEPDPGDLDIGIISDGGLDLVGVTNQLILALGRQEIDLVDLGRADPLLLMLAARDAVLLHEDPPGELARFQSLAARRFADTAKFRAAERDSIREFIAERSGGVEARE